MGFLLIVSDRSTEELFTEDLQDRLTDYTVMSPDTVRSDNPETKIPSLILIDASRVEEYEKLVTGLRRHWDDTRFIALLSPETLEGLRKLKELNVRVYLRCPVDVSTFRKARRAMKKGRKFVDPGLSDSLVEHFLE